MCPSDSPICLLRIAARVNASGPSWTAPTPTASEGLQRMASLHLPRTSPATTHRYIKAAHHGPPYDVFLILRSTTLRLHVTAAAMWTALGQGDGDLFIDARRNGTACWLAVVPARLTPWPLGVGLWFSAGMRRRLTFAGAQSRFQFPA